jgi:4-alpha-glucanotransferase
VTHLLQTLTHGALTMEGNHSSTREDAVAALARSVGIQRHHRDGLGQSVKVDRETILALFPSLGLEVETEADARRELRKRKAEELQEIVPPVSVHWQGSEPRLSLGRAIPDGTHCHLDLQEALEGERLTELAARSAGGALPLPADLSPGYYHGTVTTKEGRGSTLLVVAPPRVYGAPANSSSETAPSLATPADLPAPAAQEQARNRRAPEREWGTFLPLYALHSSRTRGVGSLTELEELLQWTAGLGGAAVGVLPLMASYLEEPFDPSPYAPASRLFWNELYLDPERLPEWERSPDARAQASSRAFQRRGRWLHWAPSVDYREAYRLQRSLLDGLSETWEEEGGMRTPEFRAFLARPTSPMTYAAFRATMASRSQVWTQWPDQWRTEGIPRDAYRGSDLRRHLYVQLRFTQALEEILGDGTDPGPGLYLDLPLGAHPLSYDRWANPGLFAPRASLGAPPDGFYPEGQDWGLPPLRPETAQVRGHSHLREVLGTILPFARYLRIDHVMGLHRLYWIPSGMKANQGAYLRYPARELYAILSVESHRHRTILAGEDLGTVPPEVREAMDRHGLRRMFVVPFEIRSHGGSDEAKENEIGTAPDQDEAEVSQEQISQEANREEVLNPVPGGAVAGVGTHDTPTWARLWEERVDLRSAFLPTPSSPPDPCAGSVGPSPLDAEEAADPAPYQGLTAALSTLARSRAGLVMVNLEDLWLEQEPQNRPGTNHPSNWVRKAQLPLERMRTDPRVLDLLKEVDRGRKTLSSDTGLTPAEHPSQSQEKSGDQ